MNSLLRILFALRQIKLTANVIVSVMLVVKVLFSVVRVFRGKNSYNSRTGNLSLL